MTAERADPQTPHPALVLECFREDSVDLLIRPAPHRRDWMDATRDGFAYRCLPLAIANAHGWEILNPRRFTAVWDGGSGRESIRIKSAPDAPAPIAVSHFGEGVLTFHVNALLRTPPGFDLWLTGPINHLKAHIQPLTGLVETDWSPFSFTMNWRFTTARERVVFDAGEPIAAFFPLQRGVIERIEPVYRKPADDPEFWAAHMAWRQSRAAFNKDLAQPDSAARAAKWQKTYMNGPEEALTPPHRTKLRAKPFIVPPDGAGLTNDPETE